MPVQELPHARELPWVRDCWQKLMGYRGFEKLPHALLISGREGLGKSRLARDFAQTLLCLNPDKRGLACNNCLGCRLFAAGNHPDFIVVEAESKGNQISVDSIRDLVSRLALKIHYEGYRVVIINPAEALNVASTNSLLKTLEEPPDNTVIVLVAESPSMIAATLASRCQTIKMRVPDKQMATEWLRQLCPDQDSDVLLAMGNGAPITAMQSTTSECIERRRAVSDAWLELAQGRDDPLQATEKLMKFPLSEVVAWLSAWVVDMIRARSAPNSARLANTDMREALQAEAQRLNLKQLFGFLDLLFRARKLLDTQANQQLLLEELLIEWTVLKRL